MNPLHRIGMLLAVHALTWASATTRAEDIDLFAMGNSAKTADSNLVIILDNTSNWNQPLGATSKFSVAKSALVAAISALTDATGRYTAPALKPSDYILTAEMTGFKKEMRRGVTLEVNQDSGNEE